MGTFLGRGVPVLRLFSHLLSEAGLEFRRRTDSSVRVSNHSWRKHQLPTSVQSSFYSGRRFRFPAGCTAKCRVESPGQHRPMATDYPERFYDSEPGPLHQRLRRPVPFSSLQRRCSPRPNLVGQRRPDHPGEFIHAEFRNHFAKRHTESARAGQHKSSHPDLQLWSGFPHQ